METKTALSKGESKPIYSSPHSLGTLIEGKRHDEFLLNTPDFDSGPHSLGTLIEWKL